MGRRAGLSALLVAWVAIALLAPTASAAAAGSGYQYRDRFDSGNYSGNLGSQLFTGDWREHDDGGGHVGGSIFIEGTDDCPTEPCVLFEIQERFMTGKGLSRGADIGGAATASFRFSYTLDLDEPTQGILQVAVYNGVTWAPIDAIPLLDNAAGGPYTRTYNVVPHAHADFAVGFFAHGYWDAALFVDDVKIWGEWDEGPPPSTTTTTLVPPVTTLPPPTTSTLPPPPTTTTKPPPPTTTTTTTTAPPVTTTTTTAPTTTTTTAAPPATTAPPTTTTTTVAPGTTTRPPPPEAPLVEDERYTAKDALALTLNDGVMALPTKRDDIPEPSPVTQIMASITTTAITVRSHFLSAMALGLLIAVAAVWGLGRRSERPWSAPGID